MSRVNESDGSNRVGLIAVMYRVGLIEGKLIKWNQMLNQKEYFMALWEMKVGQLSRKDNNFFSKSAFTGSPLVEFFLTKMLIEGAVLRKECNWTYMASLKRLSKGSGCHRNVDPGNIKRKACKKVVEQGGNLLRKTEKKEMKGEIWVTKSKRREDQHIKLI